MSFPRSVISAAGCLLLVLTANGYAQKTGKTDPYFGLPYEKRQALKSYDMRNQPLDRPVVRAEPIPWTDAMGRLLVGAVMEEGKPRRTITKDELELRVNIYVKTIDRSDLSSNDEEALFALRRQLLEDWAKTAALATYAERTGITVSEEEIDNALHELARNHAPQGEALQNVGRMIGVPERELRQEVRDGLLVEKAVRREIRENVSIEEKRRIFQDQPNAFLIPTHVDAWQIFAPQVGRLTESQREELMDELKDLRKELRRARHLDDVVRLRDKYGTNEQFVITELNDIGEDEKLPRPVKEQLFGLDVGDTSEIIRSDLGWHIVKILDRREGHRGSFEEALPQIEDYLFEISKDALYLSLQDHFDIPLNTHGLNQWRPVEAPRTVAADELTSSGRPGVDAVRRLEDRRRRGGERIPSVEEVLSRRRQQTEREAF